MEFVGRRGEGGVVEPVTRKHARTLRSKKWRGWLWLVADGKCQICGAELGDDWEADHVIPWCKEQRTNPFEMQAVCRDCNRKKGSKIG